MPFKSQNQMKAAFAGGLGPEMKSKAKQWASETPNIKKLPKRAKAPNPNDILAGGKK
jgi:hypothetical protein